MEKLCAPSKAEIKCFNELNIVYQLHNDPVTIAVDQALPDDTKESEASSYFDFNL